MPNVKIKKPQYFPHLRQYLKNCSTRLLCMTIGTILTLLFAWGSFYTSRQYAILAYQKHINDIQALFYRELSLHTQALYSLSYLFRKETPSLDTFSNIALQLLTQHSDIQGFEWIPHVPAEQRQNFEQQMQLQYPDFQFTERNQAGLFISAAERKEYFPIYYLSPLFSSPEILGFDLASEKERLAFLLEIRDSGQPQLSAPLDSIEGRIPHRIVLAVLPIYQHKPLNVEERRKQFRGFVIAVFRIEELFLQSLHSGINYGRITLQDADSPPLQNLLYSNSPLNQNEKSSTYTYTLNMPEIWSRNWIITAQMPINDYNMQVYAPTLLVFIIGIILSMLITRYIQTIMQHSAIIRNQVSQRTEELEKKNDHLRRMLKIDGMTGIANRRYMNEYLDKNWYYALRNNTSITFAICDIDYFKLYNDTYGHLEGDECLKSVTAELRKHLKRPGDLLARYGGEEFAIILVHTNNPDFFLRKCLHAVESLQIPHAKSLICNVVTISMGYCSMIPNRFSNPEDLIQIADKALYRAKQNGRNRLEEADSSTLLF